MCNSKEAALDVYNYFTSFSSPNILSIYKYHPQWFEKFIFAVCLNKYTKLKHAVFETYLKYLAV